MLLFETWTLFNRRTAYLARSYAHDASLPQAYTLLQ